MLTEELEKLQQSKAEVTYLPSDSIAVLEHSYNALAFEPVFINEASKECFVKIRGMYVPALEVPGFRRYEKVRQKTLYDTATGLTLEQQNASPV